MASLQALREFINQRLTAAAVEIFTVFQQTIEQFEEEIYQQRRLLGVNWRTQVKLHNAESPQQHIGDQKTSSSVKQEEHEAPHVKEEEDLVEMTVTDGESNNSNDSMRDLTTQRLTAAAGEIFTMSKETVVQYEEEICRQRRLLEINWNPQIKLHKTELPQPQDYREEQLFKQEPNYCGEQEDQIKEEPEESELFQIKQKQEEPELPQIKEETEEPGLLEFKEDQEEPDLTQIEEFKELRTSQRAEQLLLVCESRVNLTEEQIYLMEPGVEVEDTEQFLSHDSEDHNVKKHIESESTINTELKKMSSFPREHVENKGCIMLLRKETHTDEKPYSCETCGKRFSVHSSLLRHKRTHTGEKPYSCETCGKRFHQRGHLLSHKKTHTGEKPYSCETCGQSFSRHSNLLRHKKTHSVDKPYFCEVCGRSFSQQGKLLCHMRSHTAEKPYSCEICGKRFSQQSRLLHHKRHHTGEKPYSCETWQKFQTVE